VNEQSEPKFVTFVTYGRNEDPVDILMDITGGHDRAACEVAAEVLLSKGKEHPGSKFEKCYHALNAALAEYDRISPFKGSHNDAHD